MAEFNLCHHMLNLWYFEFITITRQLGASARHTFEIAWQSQIRAVARRELANTWRFIAQNGQGFIRGLENAWNFTNCHVYPGI